jgi:hypothetical protein
MNVGGGNGELVFMTKWKFYKVARSAYDVVLLQPLNSRDARITNNQPRACATLLELHFPPAK